jgi:bacteriocin biosynthesis cyclodehydratase domain-containing protein
MADPLRLTPVPHAPAPHAPAPHAPAPQAPVMIGGTGEFGRRVAGFLSAWRPEAREFDPADGIDAVFAGEAGAVVLALWRPEAALCEQADELSFRHSVPWLPVILEHPAIRIGPFVRPPTGPCFRCYATRKAQHDQQPWITAAMDAAYQRDQDCGPRGYLPQHARLAAAMAIEALDAGTASARRAAGGLLAGEVVTVGLVTGGLQASPVLAVHNCDRCDAPRLSAGLGLLTELAARDHLSLKQ